MPSLVATGTANGLHGDAELVLAHVNGFGAGVVLLFLVGCCIELGAVHDANLSGHGLAVAVVGDANRAAGAVGRDDGNELVAIIPGRGRRQSLVMMSPGCKPAFSAGGLWSDLVDEHAACGCEAVDAAYRERDCTGENEMPMEPRVTLCSGPMSML